MKSTVRTLIAASIIALGLSVTSAQAGGGPHQTYTPVKTTQEAEALKPGTKIATVCPSCGAVNVTTVDKEKTHMHSMTCGACKETFEVMPVGSGKTTVAKLLCRDPKTGKKMALSMCAMH